MKNENRLCTGKIDNHTKVIGVLKPQSILPAWARLHVNHKWFPTSQEVHTLS